MRVCVSSTHVIYKFYTRHGNVSLTVISFKSESFIVNAYTYMHVYKYNDVSNSQDQKETEIILHLRRIRVRKLTFKDNVGVFQYSILKIFLWYSHTSYTSYPSQRRLRHVRHPRKTGYLANSFILRYIHKVRIGMHSRVPIYLTFTVICPMNLYFQSVPNFFLYSFLHKLARYTTNRSATLEYTWIHSNTLYSVHHTTLYFRQVKSRVYLGVYLNHWTHTDRR